GEQALLDVMAGAVQMGIPYVSVYAFSTENWKRSPDEVAFLMGFSRDVLRRQRDTLNSWGVRVHWNGRRSRLWKSVIKELKTAEKVTKDNDRTNLIMCVNYGGRAEITDAVHNIATQVADGTLSPKSITDKTVSQHLRQPDVP